MLAAFTPGDLMTLVFNGDHLLLVIRSVGSLSYSIDHAPLFDLPHICICGVSETSVTLLKKHQCCHTSFNVFDFPRG